MGLEPTTPGTTIRCSNQLSYTHHIKLHTYLTGKESPNLIKDDRARPPARNGLLPQQRTPKELREYVF